MKDYIELRNRFDQIKEILNNNNLTNEEKLDIIHELVNQVTKEYPKIEDYDDVTLYEIKRK